MCSLQQKTEKTLIKIYNGFTHALLSIKAEKIAYLHFTICKDELPFYSNIPINIKYLDIINHCYFHSLGFTRTKCYKFS